MSDTTNPTPAPPNEPMPWYKNWSNIRELMAWSMNAIQFIALLIMFMRNGGVPPVPPAPIPIAGESGATGWINDPDAVTASIPVIAARQGMPAEFGQVAQGLIGAADDNKSTFFFRAEEKVFGKIQPSWDQGKIGTCVSFGWGRGCQDLMLLRIFSGEAEQWPGTAVATEPIYGGSRVEVGQGRVRGDGSVGAWAARWVQEWGLLFRKPYGQYDLTTYSVPLSRAWGNRGVPDELEPIARERPVTAVARLANGTELWAALGNNYPVPVCSNVGFEVPRGGIPADGIMEPNGNWGHCMLFRGRFTHPSKGKCVIVQNSWGNYLHKRLTVETTDAGSVELPEGCFAIRLTIADRMVRQNDTFAISSLKGFPVRRIDWTVQASPHRLPRPRFDAPIFALAP